ncbi:hypothetical protein [Vagococcus salmoninarum]|uniref:hypothetical protein n=1 Tax=Vagococcus salmoninarum TaxID=2739 RepID=UPI003F9487BF
MSQKKSYYIEESQTYHTYQFLKERQDDPKWCDAFERIQRQRLKKVALYLAIILLFLGLFVGKRVMDGELFEEHFSKIPSSQQASSTVDTTKLSEEQVITWAEAVTKERNRQSLLYDNANYQLAVRLKEDGFVYIEVVSHSQVIDLFRINGAGQLEESGSYLAGVEEDSWQVISKGYLDITEVNKYDYELPKVAHQARDEESQSDETATVLMKYENLDMKVKVLLAMSLAAASPEQKEPLIFENFKLNAAGQSDHQYMYSLINRDLLVVGQSNQQAEGLAYELYFEISDETIKPLYYYQEETEQSSSKATINRSKKLFLNNNEKEKRQLYQYYLENTSLYDQLSHDVLEDASFYKGESETSN